MQKFGDYVKYEPDNGTFKWEDIEPTTKQSYYVLAGETEGKEVNITTEKLDWMIWNIDEEKNKLVLIADGTTSYDVPLKGFMGYNNGVGILNQIGKTCYSNSKIEAVGKSISWEELEEVMINPPSYTLRSVTYGTKLYFPLMHQYEEYSGIDENLVDKGQPAMSGMGVVTRSKQPFYISSTSIGSISGYRNSWNIFKAYKV